MEDDIAWYEENYEKMFTGTANINTLPIYDFGAIDMEDGGPEINFVEMAEVIPLDKWIIQTKRGDEVDAKFGLGPAISYYDEVSREAKKNKQKLSKEQAIEKVINMFPQYNRTYAPFTKQEIESVIGAFWEMENGGRELQDVAVRNMGIMKQSDPNNPTIIIFDR